MFNINTLYWILFQIFITLIHFFRPELLLDSLVNAIPRSVYDAVISHSDIDSIIEVLRERKAVRDCVNTGKVPSTDFYRETLPNMKNVRERFLIGFDVIVILKFLF